MADKIVPRIAFNNLVRLSRMIGPWKTFLLTGAELIRRLMPSFQDFLHRANVRVRLKELPRPVHMRLGTTDRDVFLQVFADEEYAPVASLSSIHKIVDCGANIGLTSAYLLARYPGAKLLAIEAEAKNATLCSKNLSPYSNRASVIHAGVWKSGTWDSMTPLTVDRSFGDGREWAFSVKEAVGQASADSFGISIQAISNRMNGIDLLKIDIEGSEAVLFSSGSELWLPDVRNIAIELHGPERSRIFFEALRDYDFDLLRNGELTFALNLRRKAQ